MSGEDASVTVYVVGDHPDVLAGLVALIDRAEGYRVVGSSPSEPATVAEISALLPAVAVIDGDNAGSTSLEVCRQLRSAVPDIVCVMVTAGVGNHWEQSEAVDAGAAAVVLKRLVDFPLLDVIGELTGHQSGRGANR